MVHRTCALVLLLGGLALGQAPEPISAPPRLADAVGDPLPGGATARMGTLRWRHGGSVHFVGFLAEGRELVSAGLDGWIRVWEVPSGREVRRWQWYKAGVIDDDGYESVNPTIRSIALSADRRFLAASLPNGRVQVWNIKGGEERAFGAKLGRPFHGRNGIAFSPDGKTLATRGDDHVTRLWDLRTGKELYQLHPPRETKDLGSISFYGGMGNTLAFAPDGRTLAAMNPWNTEQGKGCVILHEAETGKELRRIEGGDNSRSGRLAFGPGILAVAWGDRETKLYDPETGKVLRSLGEPKSDVIIHALAFSPDGKMVATRSASSTPTIQIWETATGKKVGELGDLFLTENQNVFLRPGGPGSSSMPIDFAPDGKRIAEATGGQVVRMWDVK